MSFLTLQWLFIAYELVGVLAECISKYPEPRDSESNKEFACFSRYSNYQHEPNDFPPHTLITLLLLAYHLVLQPNHS